MSDIETIVQGEVEALHDFFTRWFNGTAEKSEFEETFLNRIDHNIVFIPPEGTIVSSSEMLATGISQGYGSNPNFRIAIRNVNIRREIEDYILVTYEEWQRNTLMSSKSNNARITTALLKHSESLSAPFKWLHLQETWLPDSAETSVSYEF